MSSTLRLGMSHASDPFFRTFHAVRIKGFSKAETIAEVADLPLSVVNEHLDGLQQREWAMFRQARQLWQLTPVGREEHRVALAQDVGGGNLHDALAGPYAAFLAANERFKELCGDWQLRDGEHNDHADAEYDRSVINRLVALDQEIAPVVQQMGSVLHRLVPYGSRLARTCQRVVEGETEMITGVMCGSYHDVWMELHEDLILTLGMDRVAEGSF
ncbi:unannotated protein [freshwater metagenome]|uniref:Unannotated protein n=1 Tax=freshwater metagenome TaxID=449393 RepID=A0A6J6TIX1_9ZZZZ